MSGFAGSAMKDHPVALAVGNVAGAALGALMRNMIVGICIGVGVCVAGERRNRRNSIGSAIRLWTLAGQGSPSPGLVPSSR